MRDEHRKEKLVMLTVLGIAGGTIYLIPYIRYVFYDWMSIAMGLDNTQLGVLTSVYGLLGIILATPSGILADRFSPKWIMTCMLAVTTITTFIIAGNIDGGYTFNVVMWSVLGFFGGLVWGSIFKIIRNVAGNAGGSQGAFYFGWYYMCNGLSGALVGVIALQLTKNLSAEKGFFTAVIVYGISTVVAMVLMALLINEKKLKLWNETEAAKLAAAGVIPTQEEQKFRWGDVATLLKTPMLYVLMIVCLGGYLVYSSSSYFTPYLTDVVGVTPTDSGYFSIIRTYVFYILTPLSGMMADKILHSTSKWFVILFACLAATYFGILFISFDGNVMAASLYTLLPGLFGLALYGIQFSIVSECKIPAKVMGTAVGIVSTVSYTVDVWAPPLFGHWLDIAGNKGYIWMFTFICIVCAAALVGAIIIRRHNIKHSIN